MDGSLPPAAASATKRPQRSGAHLTPLLSDQLVLSTPPFSPSSQRQKSEQNESKNLQRTSNTSRRLREQQYTGVRGPRRPRTTNRRAPRAIFAAGGADCVLNGGGEDVQTSNSSSSSISTVMTTTKQTEKTVHHQPTAPKTPIGFRQFAERLAVASSPIEAVSRQQDVTKQPSLTNEAGVNRPPMSQDRKRAAAGGSNAGLILSPASYSSRETRVIRKKWKRGLHEGQSSPPLLGHHGCIPYTNPPNSSKTTGLETDDHVDVKLKRALSSQSVFLSEKLPPPPVSAPLLDRSHTSELTIRAMETAPLPHQLVLPTVQSSRHPDLNVISPHTVTKLLQGAFKTQLDGFKLLDCRFPFEFQGGSLVGASPLCDPDTMEEQFFGPSAMENSTYTAIIFFCEFSANRAPKMLRHVRNLDRKLNADRYPELFYPELYLIDGGYKNCFETLQREICAASALYTPMDDERFVEDCRLEFAAWRKRWKPHKVVAHCAMKLYEQQLKPAPRQLHPDAGSKPRQGHLITPQAAANTRVSRSTEQDGIQCRSVISNGVRSLFDEL